MSVAREDVPGSLSSRLNLAETELKEYCDAARLTETCLGALARARAELAAGHLAEAQNLALRVECLLTRARKSRETLLKWGTPICLYEVALLLVLLWLALGAGQ